MTDFAARQEKIQRFQQTLDPSIVATRQRAAVAAARSEAEMAEMRRMHRLVRRKVSQLVETVRKTTDSISELHRRVKNRGVEEVGGGAGRDRTDE